MLETLDREELEKIIVGAGYVLTESEMKSSWPIEGVIHPELTCITGQPEQGKSTLIESLCLALLAGTDWLGRRVHFASDARILVGCESNASIERLQILGGSEWMRRLCAFRLTPWIDGGGLSGDRIRGRGFGLVVIDSVLTAGGNPNDQDLSSEFIGKVRALQVPTVLVHHEPKADSRGPSGAQMWRAAYRQTVKVTRFSAPSGQNGMKLRLSGNDLDGVQEIALVVDRATGEALEVGSAERRPVRSRISKEEQARRVGEIVAELGVDPLLVSAPGDLAAVLLGGPRDGESPAKKVQVGTRIGARGGSISHRTLAALISGHRQVVEVAARSSG